MGDDPKVSETCSRYRSREVRSYLNSNFYPVYPSTSRACEINIENDIFRDQEENKLKIANNDWLCKYCQKHFKSEFYLDRHMGLKHVNKLNVS
jgi:hypothetical protein